MSEKAYLGDSVYAETDAFGIVLTTENGCGPTNEIYVNSEVYAALLRFVDRRRETATSPPEREVLGGLDLSDLRSDVRADLRTHYEAKYGAQTTHERKYEATCPDCGANLTIRTGDFLCGGTMLEIRAHTGEPTTAPEGATERV